MISPRLGWLPPLLSGVFVLRRGDEHTALVEPGEYQSSLGDFDLHLERFDWIARVFALRGYFEWRIAAVASVVVQPGDAVFEAGAHYGTETLYYGWLVGNEGRVVSFEAEANLAKSLIQEIERVGMRQCVISDSAVGRIPGTAVFEPSPDPDLNSGLGSLAPPEARGGTQVRVETLDGTMETHGAPRLVVMDIQGGELDALRGGTAVLRKARPVLILEVESGSLARMGGSALEVQRLLEQHGYQCWRFTRMGLRKVTSPLPDELGDWLALPREQSRQLLTPIRKAIARAAVTPPRSRLGPFGAARARRRGRRPSR